MLINYLQDTRYFTGSFLTLLLLGKDTCGRGSLLWYGTLLSPYNSRMVDPPISREKVVS